MKTHQNVEFITAGETWPSRAKRADAVPPAPVDEAQALLADYLAAGNLDDQIPKIARDAQAIQRIELLVRGLPTAHELIRGDARAASALEPNSIHLVVTSPPTGR